MLVRGLWGIQIGPQSDQVIKVEASFRITMASIFEFNGPERTSVYVRFQDATFLLCSLIPEKIEQQVLDITCLQGEEITLRVDGPNVIHLLGNYISQDGIDDQKDDEIGFLELNGSDVEEPADAMLEKTTPAITFPMGREGLGFDESDEFESNSESQAESESESDTASESETMTYYDVARLASYADRLTPTTSSSLETTKDMEEYIPPPPPTPLNAEGAGRYVLINGNASVGSSVAESEPLDQQSDTSGAVADQASLSDSQHHVIKTEEQDNMDMDSRVKQMAEDNSKHESSQEPEHESEQASEQVSEYEPEVESEQVSEYEPDHKSMDESDYESNRESEHEVKQEPQQESCQEPHQEQEHESHQEAEHEPEHEQKLESEHQSKPEPASKPVAKPTSVSAPEPTQQLTSEPAKTLSSKPEQTAKADKKVAKSNKQQKAKKKSDSVPANTPSPAKKKPDLIPANTPSPIKKKADKPAKKQAKKLAAALAKQQESKADSNKDVSEKEKKAQQNKEKNKIKAKKISKKKQALANNNQASSQNKSTEGSSSQDIRSLVLGAFANMAAAIQSAATAKPSAAPKLKKIKVEPVDQDVIPEVVASKVPKPRGRPPKPKASATPAVSQNGQTQSLDASDPGTVSSTQPKKKKKAAKKLNVTQNDTFTAAAAAAPVPIDPPAAAPPVPIDPPAAAPPVPIAPPAAAPVSIDIPTSSPIVIDISRSSTSSPTPSDRVRYPRKAVDTDSMQKLALFAQEDAKSADDVRKERKKKKKSQRADETVAKKARLSIE